MLIGVNGNKGAGKDTIGQYLVENYGFKRLSFAEKLKKSSAVLFEIPPEKWEEWKNDPLMMVSVYRRGKYDLWTPDAGEDIEQYSMTVRTFLQRYGTEAHRNIFGDDFWVDALFRDFDHFDGNDYVITDARFTNELRAIKERNGFNIRVVRDVGTKVVDPHASEQMPPLVYIDSTIYNNGSFEDLYDEVDEFMRNYPLIGNVAEFTAPS